MNIKELYPIGTVVLLKEGKKKVMIIGVKQICEAENQEYDYLAVTYPEGFMGNDVTIFFNHSAIEELYHLGYRNEEQDLFLHTLEEFYASNREA